MTMRKATKNLCNNYHRTGCQKTVCKNYKYLLLVKAGYRPKLLSIYQKSCGAVSGAVLKKSSKNSVNNIIFKNKKWPYRPM